MLPSIGQSRHIRQDLRGSPIVRYSVSDPDGKILRRSGCQRFPNPFTQAPNYVHRHMTTIKPERGPRNGLCCPTPWTSSASERNFPNVFRLGKAPTTNLHSPFPVESATPGPETFEVSVNSLRQDTVRNQSMTAGRTDCSPRVVATIPKSFTHATCGGVARVLGT